ncbi:MAG: holo-ACP synthase [Anaerolineae bacterium]
MLTTGVDLVEITRVERVLERYGHRFLERIFTPDEVRFSRGRSPELAARFAAKEAVSKALGVGMLMLSPVGIGWRDVEVLNDRRGKPTLTLHGQARRLAEAQGLTEWSVSLSHDGGLAVAFVVALGGRRL